MRIKSLFSFTTLFILLIFGYLIAQDKENVYELIFSHELHSTELEMECLTCHGAAGSSQAGTDNLLPEMSVCGDCHDVEDDEQCGMCHSNLDEPLAVARIVTYSAKFSHEKHLASDLDCMACHAPIMEKAEVGAPESLPGMVSCMNCHDNKGVINTCESCHLPEEELKPESHTINFIHTHSDLARMNETKTSGGFNCQTCHSKNYCQDCHEGENLDRRTHPLNFEFNHALAAIGKEAECASCHTDRQFCIDCHRDSQIMPHNHRPGWAIPNVGGRHKDEAMQNLENCMACHEQNAEQICQPCHAK